MKHTLKAMTQEDLAHTAQLSQGNVSGYLKDIGDSKILRNPIRKILDVLGLDVAIVKDGKVVDWDSLLVDDD